MMNHIYNGMPAGDLGSEGWYKPWSGGNGGNCVEAMKLADGRVAVRQSADPDGPALIYSNGEIAAFIQGAKAGQADFLLT
ncbi:putative AbaA-like protein [Streptomyces sp. W007]|nr:putative AbaA-like protein [Streptomyces sp. W007]